MGPGSRNVVGVFHWRGVYLSGMGAGRSSTVSRVSCSVGAACVVGAVIRVVGSVDVDPTGPGGEGALGGGGSGGSSGDMVGEAEDEEVEVMKEGLLAGGGWCNGSLVLDSVSVSVSEEVGSWLVVA